MTGRQGKLLPGTTGAINQYTFGLATERALPQKVANDVTDHDAAHHQGEEKENWHQNANGPRNTR